jgi:hypothetical protein
MAATAAPAAFAAGRRPHDRAGRRTGLALLRLRRHLRTAATGLSASEAAATVAAVEVAVRAAATAVRLALMAAAPAALGVRMILVVVVLGERGRRRAGGQDERERCNPGLHGSTSAEPDLGSKMPSSRRG